jgi:hypothetical protein
VLYPANSADPTSGNDIIIDYDVTGIGMTDPNYATGGYSHTGGLVEGTRIWLKQVTARIGWGERSEPQRSNRTFPAGMLGFAALTPTYASYENSKGDSGPWSPIKEAMIG